MAYEFDLKLLWYYELTILAVFPHVLPQLLPPSLPIYLSLFKHMTWHPLAFSVIFWVQFKYLEETRPVIFQLGFSSNTWCTCLMTISNSKQKLCWSFSYSVHNLNRLPLISISKWSSKRELKFIESEADIPGCTKIDHRLQLEIQGRTYIGKVEQKTMK